MAQRDLEQKISVTEGGARLDQFLAGQLVGYSRGHLKELISRGCVQVDGLKRSADYRLKEGEAVSVLWPICGWADVPFELWVLFEDPEILVLHKPAGLLMHPAGSSWLKTPEAALSEPEPNLAGLLLVHRPQIIKSGTARCGLVHRLDRETSGVLVVAKTPAAQQGLVSAFAQRRVEKVYRGIVLGRVDGSIHVDAPLGRSGGGRKIEVSPWGKTAETSIDVKERGKNATLVEARPRTGRTHQIRAHLAHLRHPVLGDPEQLQASPERLKASGVPIPPRLMLHAWKLSFAHPTTGRPLRFTAPLPKDFRDYWKLVKE